MHENRSVLLLKWIARRGIYLRREMIMLWEKILYQPSSRFLLHPYNATRCPCEAVLFYSFAGRTLFGLRELIALLSKGRIFRKSITLEGFETAAPLPEKGSHTMLWPRSPFVKNRGSEPDNDYLNRMARSYGVTWSHYTLPFGHTADWQKATEHFRELLFDRQEHLRPESLRNFRQNHLFERIIADRFEQVDTRKSYFSQYLRAIDLVLEYHRSASVIDKEILATLSESRAGGTTCVRYRGLRLSEKLLFYATAIHDLQNHVPMHPEGSAREVILDIGTGYGALPHYLSIYRPNALFILVDLPEVLLLAAWYLRYNFPDAKIVLAEDLHKSGGTANYLETADFLLIPPAMLELLPDNCVDLTLNTASMGFLTEEYLSFYLAQISRVLKAGGHFYSINKTETCRWGVGMHAWDLKEEYVTIHYAYNNRFAYPQWLGRKIE